ncbi:MAG TPA: heavy metal translocating P-type ATPase metal-binding domain-containing protein [Alphaproteobacteria bacterium]
MTALAPAASFAIEPPVAAAARCAHCGGALPSDARESFCCIGCAAAYRLIHDLGFDEFYRRRQIDASARPLRPDPAAEIDYAPYVITGGDGRATLHLMVDGLTCGACVWLVESVLAREPDIIDGRVNMSTRRLTLTWRGPAGDAARYAGLLTALGFRVVPFDPQRIAAATNASDRELLRAMAVAGFAAGNVMLLSISVWAGHVEGMGQATRDLMHWVSALIALPAIAYAGRPFFRSAVRALSARRTNMDVPISIGVLLAAGMSVFETATSGAHAYFDSAITLLFFLLVGRYLDGRARGRARSAVDQLLALSAAAVTVLRSDGSTALKAPTAVKAGDIVLVTAGERIAVDGRITSGRTDLDTSLVTGESVPAAAGPGTPVFAGMVNLTAPVRIEVTATGEGTLLAEVVRLVEAAEQGRSRFVAIADRVARLYAPVVHVLAAATFIGWFAFGGIGWQPALLNAVAVLIITCPCALALAVPVVQVIASGRLLRGGILLKSATALERMAEIDTVVLDKTGTLTLGRPELRPDPARADEDLRLAAGLAQASRHPLARALARAAPDVPAAPGVVEHPGRGLSVDTAAGEIRLGSRAFCGISLPERADENGPELWLQRPGRAPVRFLFDDRLRPDAAATIRALRARGLKVELLSGDRSSVVAAAAATAGVEAWRGDCDPAAKCAHLADLRRAGRKVLMVGDGLNDAPALASAHVSVSPANAADVSQTTADAVFQGDRLSKLVELLDVARQADRLVRQNIALAILYNMFAVPVAVAGYVTPLLAAIAMSSSSVIVIANAMRLGHKRRADS